MSAFANEVFDSSYARRRTNSHGWRRDHLAAARMGVGAGRLPVVRPGSARYASVPHRASSSLEQPRAASSNTRRLGANRPPPPSPFFLLCLGPLLVVAVPPIRKQLGYVDRAALPTNFPGT